MKVRSARIIKPGVAVIHRLGKVFRAGETEVPAKAIAIQTFFVTRHGDEWIIDAFQNTPIKEMTGLPPAPKR